MATILLPQTHFIMSSKGTGCSEVSSSNTGFASLSNKEAQRCPRLEAMSRSRT